MREVGDLVFLFQVLNHISQSGDFVFQSRHFRFQRKNVVLLSFPAFSRRFPILFQSADFGFLWLSLTSLASSLYRIYRIWNQSRWWWKILLAGAFEEPSGYSWKSLACYCCSVPKSDSEESSSSMLSSSCSWKEAYSLILAAFRLSFYASSSPFFWLFLCFLASSFLKVTCLVSYFAFLRLPFPFAVVLSNFITVLWLLGSFTPP